MPGGVHRAPMSQDPHDQLLLQIRGAVAEYERTLISERMRRGRLSRLRAGQLLPWVRVPFGYQVETQGPGWAAAGWLCCDNRTADLCLVPGGRQRPLQHCQEADRQQHSRPHRQGLLVNQQCPVHPSELGLHWQSIRQLHPLRPLPPPQVSPGACWLRADLHQTP